MDAREGWQTLDVLPSAGETLGRVDGRHVSYNDVHTEARIGLVGKPDDHDTIDQILVTARKSRRSQDDIDIPELGREDPKSSVSSVSLEGSSISS